MEKKDKVIEVKVQGKVIQFPSPVIPDAPNQGLGNGPDRQIEGLASFCAVGKDQRELEKEAAPFIAMGYRPAKEVGIDIDYPAIQTEHKMVLVAPEQTRDAIIARDRTTLDQKNNEVNRLKRQLQRTETL
jgi:hypothetical protein